MCSSTALFTTIMLLSNILAQNHETGQFVEASDETIVGVLAQAQQDVVLSEQELDGSDASARSALTPAFAAKKRNADAIIALVDDPNPDVRYEAATFLRHLWREDRITALVRACRRDGADPRFSDVLVEGAQGVSRPVLRELANDAAFCAVQENGPILRAIAKLAMVAREGNDVRYITSVLDALPEDAHEARKAVVSGFAAAAIDNGNWNTLLNIAQSREAANETMTQILAEARAVATDSSLAPEVRVPSIELLAYDTFENAGELLVGLLSPTESFEIQASAVRVLSRIGNPRAVALMLNVWPDLAPQIRWNVMSAITRDDVWILALMDTAESGAITVDSLMRWGFLDLLRSPNNLIRNRATDLLSKRTPESTDVVMETYQRIRLLEPNVAEGKILFENNCAKCHQLDGHGIPVGPDLGFTANAGEYVLLKSILLPNLEVNPVYYSYTVETEDFEAFTGIVSQEEGDSLVILGPSADTHAVARENISSVVSSDQTLMPEGWGESLGDQGLADLIGYMVDVAGAAAKRQREALRAENL